MILPDDTIAVYLAVRRPCVQRHRVCIDRAYPCDGCQGDGTRIVPTEVEVKPDGPTSFEMDDGWWREVPS